LLRNYYTGKITSFIFYLDRLPDLNPEVTESVNCFERYSSAQHINHVRETRSIANQENHPYMQHPLEVRVRAKELINMLLQYGLLPAHEMVFLQQYPEVLDIVSLGHDIIEDAKPTECSERCNLDASDCGWRMEMLRMEIRSRLEDFCFAPTTINWAMSGLEAMTKGGKIELTKDSPFWLKLIKLADNWHNLATLFGRSFEKGSPIQKRS
jgi:hypothetical protein